MYRARAFTECKFKWAATHIQMIALLVDNSQVLASDIPLSSPKFFRKSFLESFSGKETRLGGPLTSSLKRESE
jgi:hypothetical protein